MLAGGTSLVLEGILAGFPGVVGGDDGGVRAGVAGAFTGGSAVSAKFHICSFAGWGSLHGTVAVVFHHVDVGVCATASALAVHDKFRPLDSWWHPLQLGRGCSPGDRALSWAIVSLLVIGGPLSGLPDDVFAGLSVAGPAWRHSARCLA